VNLGRAASVLAFYWTEESFPEKIRSADDAGHIAKTVISRGLRDENSIGSSGTRSDRTIRTGSQTLVDLAGSQSSISHWLSRARESLLAARNSRHAKQHGAENPANFLSLSFSFSSSKISANCVRLELRELFSTILGD